MVDFARVQNRIYYGYTQASKRLGTSHLIYRSPDGINPIQSNNQIGTQLISIDQDLTYKKTKKYGDMVWQFLPEDGLNLQNYDYMVGSTVTYFIVDVAPDGRLSPPTCVECNAIISITAPSNKPLNPGVNPYQSYQKDIPSPILQNCPVSILQHGKMDTSNMRLPTSVRLPYYSIILPEFDDVVIQTGYVITDDIGRRLNVLSAERTKKTLGFRIIAVQDGV